MNRLLKFALFLLVSLLTAGPLWGSETESVPYVDAQIDPARSFWLDHVHYPYPVRFATVADTQGRPWELAYLDVFEGAAEARAKAPVLVLLHGRGMNSGYWGELMRQPLAAGWRVIAIDWAHSGKSLPRNLDRPLTRSLDDVRHSIYQLVVKQLGIDRASLLGHSLGGQVAAGYALRYPQHVSRLVLYASGGLSLRAPLEVKGIRVDDPALASQPERVLDLWKAGVLPSFGATPEAVERSFYDTSTPGKLPYLQRSENALNQFIVASRAALLKGNTRERERFSQGFAWDSLAAVSECRADDAQALPNRLPRLKMPVFLALGLKDPIVAADAAVPLHAEARRNKTPLAIKVYEQAGHFIHTDLPAPFSADVLAFLHTGEVPGPLFAGEFAKRTALTALTPDVRQFVDRVEAAWTHQDLNAIRALYHPECRTDGKNLDQIMAQIATYYAMISSWKTDIYAVEPGPDGLLNLDLEFRNNFGNYPMKAILKKVDGAWYFYGNQK